MRTTGTALLTLTLMAIAPPAISETPSRSLAMLSTDDLVVAVRCSALEFMRTAKASGYPLGGMSGSVDFKHVVTTNSRTAFGFKIPFSVIEFGPTGEATSTSGSSVTTSYALDLKDVADSPPVCAHAVVRGVDGRGHPLKPSTARLFTSDAVFAKRPGVLTPSSVEIAQNFAITRSGSAGLKVDLKVFTADIMPLKGSKGDESSYKVKFELTCSNMNSMGFEHDCKPAK